MEAARAAGEEEKGEGRGRGRNESATPLVMREGVDGGDGGQLSGDVNQRLLVEATDIFVKSIKMCNPSKNHLGEHYPIKA